jgi:two-component system sensor histidine kinase DesK
VNVRTEDPSPYQLRQWWKKVPGPMGAPWPQVPAGYEHMVSWRAKRWAMFSTPWLVYLLAPIHAMWQEAPRYGALIGTLLLVAFGFQYALLVPRVINAESPRRRYALLGLMLLTCTLASVPAGYGAVGGLVYVASAGIILLPLRQSVPFALLLAAINVVVPPLVPAWHVGPQWGTAASVLGASFIGFGFIALVRNNAALRIARVEVAQLAAEQERLRIARDMHDVLGHTLTTVTVKAELARRLVYRDPDRAEAELADVERLARQSLADVRAVVAGYREVSLAVELATAKEVLAAAGMSADLPQAVDAVPGELRELFGWAVREGVTNAVRHSRASQVRVVLGERSVEVVDDGTGDGSTRPAEGTVAPPAGRPGTGLAGLAERAARLGGRLEAGPIQGSAGGHGYRLRVEVPLTSPSPSPSPSASASVSVSVPPSAEVDRVSSSRRA